MEHSTLKGLPPGLSLGSYFALVFVGYGLSMLVRYLVLAGGAAWALGRFKELFEGRRIDPGGPDWAQWTREFGWSLSTFAVFGGYSVINVWLFRTGWSRLYLDSAAYGYLWLGLSLVVVIFLHDAYFYWLHRLIHLKPLYWTHRLHHRFTRPTPWASFAFHPAEALGQGAIVTLLLLFLPLHPWTLLAFMFFMTAMNVIGHLGHEFFPEAMTSHWLFKLDNTATHHAQHHQYGRCNYGLYFNFWDRLMGTNHPEYFERLAQVQRQSARFKEARG